MNRIDVICTRSDGSTMIALTELVIALSAGPDPWHLFFTGAGVQLLSLLASVEAVLQPTLSARELQWIRGQGYDNPALALRQISAYADSRCACRTWCDLYGASLPDTFHWSSLPVVLQQNRAENGQIIYL